jgi:DNA mismatch endonuclease (patch repair protein)
MMSGIRAKNTRPEIFLRKGLHALGFRFRLHAKEIPGKPDIVFPKYKALIEVQGCFWQGHSCDYFKLPKTNSEFWRNKIEANRIRDQHNRDAQQTQGWRTLIVWECATRSHATVSQGLDVITLITNWLTVGSGSTEIDERGLRKMPTQTPL